MNTPEIIILLGAFIFLGHYLVGVFDRKSIPDVLGLMVIGMVIGPGLHLIEPTSFGVFGPLFSNIVLLFILFESGTDLKLSEIKGSFKESARITVVSFFVTWISTALFCYFILGLPILPCLFIGSALGGTSSAVVAGLVKKIPVGAKTSATLIIESAESDVFTLLIPISLLGLMTTGSIEPHMILGQFAASLIMAVLIGIGGGFLWSWIVSRTPTLKSTSFSTPAFLLLLYGLTEYMAFSGAMTAIAFGITIGNIKYIEPRYIERIIPDRDILLDNDEKYFFSEIVFLLRTFFFVFIGISIRMDRMDWFLWGAVLTAVHFLLRLITVRFLFNHETPRLDRAVISMMIPKGLGAAVIATLPVQQGVEHGPIMQAICFSVIFFSTVYCIVLFFLLKKDLSKPLYALVFPEGKQGK